VKPSAVFSAVACILAGAALAVSLLYAGPAGPAGLRGPAGPQGQTGHNAEVAHLGVCWDMGTYLNSGATDSSFSGALTAPVLTAGVPSCPVGSFVSVVPQSAP